MMKLKQLLVVPLTAVLLSACTATTSLRSSDPSLAVRINNDAPLVLKNPVSKTYKATSFGQYRFRATQEGMEPMYGLMPLKFNSGYLVADILFFAPAAFYNLPVLRVRRGAGCGALQEERERSVDQLQADRRRGRASAGLLR